MKPQEKKRKALVVEMDSIRLLDESSIYHNNWLKIIKSGNLRIQRELSEKYKLS